MGLEWGGSEHRKPLMTIRIEEIDRAINRLTAIGRQALTDLVAVPDGTFGYSDLTKQDKGEE